MASPTPASPPRRTVRPTRRVVVAAASGLVLVVGLVLLWRATQPVAFDRPLAIDRALDASGGRLTRAQATCFVDRVRVKVGSRYLEPDVSIPGAVGQQMTAIRDDCVGIAGLGSPPSTPVPLVPATEAGNQPMHHGQDAALDALWSSCAAGSGAACDELFDRSPIGSQYEQFALTCGGRTPQMTCAATYRIRPSTPTSTTSTTSPTSKPVSHATSTTSPG